MNMVKNANNQRLRAVDKVDISLDPYGKLSSQIMTNYFGTPRQRNLTVANDIDEAIDALRNKDTERFNKLFDKLLPIIGASDADMVNLRIEAKRRGMV